MPPLTYTITTYTKSYKLHAKVEFNRAVNMSISEFTKYIQIKTQNRAIKPSEFTATKTSSTVYTVAFKNSTSLNEMALSFGFMPGFITDAYGNALSTSDVSVSVDTVTAVT